MNNKNNNNNTNTTRSSFRTGEENEAARVMANVFDESPQGTLTKLATFTKYVPRQALTRFLAMYEVYSRVLGVKGSVVECGVWRGFSLMGWAKLSAILEPVNHNRHIYGFDTFGGFASVTDKDNAEPGEYSDDSYNELMELTAAYDNNRYIGHIPKVFLVRGDATETIPRFLEENPHIVIAMLFLDFDLYEPTKTALECFYPRIPRGGIIAFDELDSPPYPGETMALLETVGISSLKIRRVPFIPSISYAVVD